MNLLVHSIEGCSFREVKLDRALGGLLALSAVIAVRERQILIDKL